MRMMRGLRFFPRFFITTSMNDTRVLYVEPMKWLARLQRAGVDAVAKIEVEAGHGGYVWKVQAVGGDLL